MDIDVRTNVKEMTKKLSKIQKKQVPFATSLALNMTGDDVAQSVTGAMKQYLDRPTPFTLNAFMTKGGRFKGIKAKKNKLVATIIPGAAQAEYLKYQIIGGVRNPKAKKIAIPTSNARLNKYGNIPNRKSGLIKKPSKQFIATIKGVTGVWERYGRGGKQIRLIHGFEDNVTYQPRFPMFQIAAKTVNRRFNKNFAKALSIAMQTAK